KPSGPGMHVTVFSSLSADFTGMPTQFTAVPDAEGRFDFGALDVGDRDFIEVVSFPLDEPGHELDGKPFHGQFLQLGQRDKGFDVPLAGQHVVTLRALGTVGSDDPIGFTLWDEKGGEISTERNEVSLRWNLTDGTWLARATQGDRASPLVGFRLASTEDADNAEDVGLVLQPCPAWTVHLVDQHGAPLADDFLKLGNDASAGFPAPCRVEASCEGGLVSLEGLFPGPYLVQFDGGSKRAFTVNLDLQPGDQPVTVNVPEAR
ncbi:MAG TPA: hypothetical protein VK824_06500, partial [Planctomycetota bacterium]|nr:hypothetical protein [Planctomycetota bacterium]